MSNYTIGIDQGNGEDYTSVVIVRQRSIRWYHRLLKWLGLRKHLIDIEVVESFTVKPSSQTHDDVSK